MEFPVPSLSPAPACRTRKSSFIPASSCCCRRSDPDSSYSTACNVQVIGSNSLKIAECKVNNLNGQFFPQLNFRHTLVFIKLPTGSVFYLKLSIFQKYSCNKDVDKRIKKIIKRLLPIISRSVSQTISQFPVRFTFAHYFLGFQRITLAPRLAFFHTKPIMK